MTSTVTVHLAANLQTLFPDAPVRRVIELDEPATVRDAVVAAGLPPVMVFKAVSGGRPLNLDDPVPSQGDLYLLAPMAGG